MKACGGLNSILNAFGKKGFPVASKASRCMPCTEWNAKTFP